MNRKELAKKLSTRLDMKLSDAEHLVLSFGKIVTETLDKNDKLLFSNFGTFRVIVYPQKTLWHPATGKKMTIPPQNIIKWMPSENLKELVQGKTIAKGNSIVHKATKKHIEDFEPVDPYLSEEYVIPVKITRTVLPFREEIVPKSEIYTIPIKTNETEVSFPEIYQYDDPVLAVEPNINRNISDTTVTIDGLEENSKELEELAEYCAEEKIPIEDNTVTVPNLPSIDPEIIASNNSQKLSLTIDKAYANRLKKDRPSLWNKIFRDKTNLNKITTPSRKRAPAELLPHHEVKRCIAYRNDSLKIDSRLTDLLPYSFILGHKVVPVEQNYGTLFVAMVDPMDFDLIFEISKLTGKNISPLLSSIEEIEILIDEIPENKVLPYKNNRVTPPASRILDTTIRRAIRQNADKIDVTKSQDETLIACFSGSEELSQELIHCPYEDIEKIAYKTDSKTTQSKFPIVDIDGNSFRIQISFSSRDKTNKFSVKILDS